MNDEVLSRVTIRNEQQQLRETKWRNTRWVGHISNCCVILFKEESKRKAEAPQECHGV